MKAGGEVGVDTEEDLIFGPRFPATTKGGLQKRRIPLKSRGKADRMAFPPPTDSAEEAKKNQPRQPSEALIY